ncbi:response regulator transcription factor [Agaribacterium haliotis]|uniref:response regulator transcription factor n=1 Tax=Agaribacterium haliotis TaxID=2013869 RepID=UPI000BB56A05|nr:response regulator transcription factor [Agaribacterium haliotis]
MKILLVEDQAMVRGALKALLNLEQELEVVHDCASAEQAQHWLTHNSVDLVLSDIELPGINGIDLIEWIKKQTFDPHCVIVTTFGRAGYIRRAIDAGADAFLLKDAPSEQLAKALHRVSQGHKVIDAELALKALGDKNPLSDKERRALALAADGLSSRDIAKRLCLSDGTVRNYLSEAISKLHAANRIDAARIARQQGWL